MRAIVWKGGQKFQVEQVAAPKAAPGRIVARIEAAAVCGSDSHLEDFGAVPPLIPGHEAAGVVVEVGEGVHGLACGDRVAFDPVQRCGACWCCTQGVEHLCTNYRHLGDRQTPGCWAEYVAIDAVNAHVLPATLDFASACLTEPAAVCYHSLRRGALQSGQSVLIIGDGPFGFLHAQMAVALGAGLVIVAGHYDERLKRIAATTPCIVCNTGKQDLDSLLSKEVGPPGVDLAVEATGSGSVPNLALHALRPRGTLVIFSYIWQPQPLAMSLIHMNEINVVGSCRSHQAYRPVLEMIGAGAINTAAAIDLRAPLEDCPGVMQALRQKKAEIFKAVFLPQQRAAAN